MPVGGSGKEEAEKGETMGAKIRSMFGMSTASEAAKKGEKTVGQQKQDERMKQAGAD